LVSVQRWSGVFKGFLGFKLGQSMIVTGKVFVKGSILKKYMDLELRRGTLKGF
jgi:hypothetical protein